MRIDGASQGTSPARAGLVLGSLILVAAVANVALPSIAAKFGSSQTALNLIAVGYSLGLAASVLYLGAVGDRYRRKLLLVLEEAGVASFDYDGVVIGWGFGGSAAALRAVEKG